ncbi:Dnah17 [Symbiodinium natans]|uniref:Dnah17 protein n=1 Tax=Symbiodinium natans TaxID=878477 RepID=A0A812JZ72_9DINO|nr:Dnah17 [Symbiodinium natans]
MKGVKKKVFAAFFFSEASPAARGGPGELRLPEAPALLRRCSERQRLSVFVSRAARLGYAWLAGDVSMKVTVSQLNASLAYGFEYLGSLERLVMTLESERCWISLTQAFRRHLGVAVGGACGAGKTELSKGLSAALGSYCVVYRCGEAQAELSDLSSQFMEGVAQQGCWLLLDGIHALPNDVLGTWALQFRRFQEALRAGRDSFDLQGRMVSLKPGAFVSATFDKNWHWSTAEPLMGCLRPLSLATPSVAHVAHLAEVLLLAEGFSEDPDLGRRVGTLWGHWTALSQEPRAFGLRALRVLIEKAGRLRRCHDEGSGLAGLAVEVFEPNLLAQLFEYCLGPLVSQKEEVEDGPQNPDFKSVDSVREHPGQNA